MPLPFTLPTISEVKLPQINGLTIFLILLIFFLLVRVWHWLKPDPDFTKQFAYELLSSESEKPDHKRAADLRKVIAVAAFFLVVFLLVKKQLMAGDPKTNAVAGTSDGNIDSLLWFIASLLGLGVLATKFRESTARAGRAKKIEIDKPVPVVPVAASAAEGTGPAPDPDEVK